MKLNRTLKLPESIGLSLSIVSPTLAAAFNITLVVRSAGHAAPLTFVLGAVAMALIALSFIAFSRRVTNAGSAYAYITHSWGPRAGFIAGWTLLLSYLGAATGTTPLVGQFVAAAARDIGVNFEPGALLIDSGALVLAWWFAYRDMRAAGRLMLALEAFSVIAIVVLCVEILSHARPTLANTLTVFRPDNAYQGWTGVGAGMVFSILSFSGFEGATTLSEEAVDAKHQVPLALFGTLMGSAVFFVFVTYCEVVGYGVDQMSALGSADAPLNDLALHYGSRHLAIGLDIAAAVSSFSAVLGGLAAAGRMLFALGRGGLSRSLATIDRRHHLPTRAISVAALISAGPMLLGTWLVGGGNYYSYATTVEVFAVILAYIAVGCADISEQRSQHRYVRLAIGLLGPALLIWVLVSTVYPAPPWPNNLWPYVTALWELCAFLIVARLARTSRLNL